MNCTAGSLRGQKLSSSRDLVPDTHIIPDIVFDDRCRMIIKDRCDIIWMPRFVQRKEMPVQPWARLIASITAVFDDLKREGKLFIESGTGIRIPREIKRALTRCGAGKGDFEVVKVAFHRLRKGRRVIILSRNPHITGLIPLLRGHGIGVSDSEKYCEYAC